MEIDRRQQRLNAIKLKFIFLPTKCDCCGEKYKLEKMWTFYRDVPSGIGAEIKPWHFCRNCMQSREEVLEEIDTDAYPFGLHGVDPFLLFPKKSYTRFKIATQKAKELAEHRRKQIAKEKEKNFSNKDYQ